MTIETVAAVNVRLQNRFKATPPYSTVPYISPSLVAMWAGFIYVIAVEIVVLQNLMSIFQAENEAVAEKAIPPTAEWIKSMCLKFQYSATIPQIAQINTDYSISYPVIDTTLQIILACAIVPTNGGVINIKAAKQNPPIPLTGPELTALNGYCDTFLPAGAMKNVISVITDILRIDATIFFNGQYVADMVPGGTVELAIINYMLTLSFNGIVKVSDIEKIIMAVPGVTDVSFTQVTATPIGGMGINMIFANTEFVRQYQTYSGSIKNDPVNPLSTSLTYIVG